MKLDLKELTAKLTNTPIVVDEGTSGIWTYRKWNSGIVECWGVTATASYACTTAYGSLYYAPLSSYNFPNGLFSTRPEVNLTAHNANGCFAGINNITTGGVSFYAYAPRNSTQNISFNIYAIGT